MQPVTRDLIESFLYREASLLDDWQLQEWLKLFAPDGEYLVPPMDARELGPERALYLVDDDYARLCSRVKQLQSGKAFSEVPLSRTRRSVTNVMFEPLGGDGLRVRANFVVHRIRRELLDVYVGRYEHTLVEQGGELRFRTRKAILDLEALRPQGKLSIIL